MKRYILTILLVLFSTQIWAEGEVEGLQLAEAPINRTDIDSIKRGAKFFAGNCMSCHTLTYLTYDKLVKEAGIVTNNKPISLNGVTPPDLSLEAESRGVNWIYTYLHSFYKDPKTASGANNLIFPGTAMPYIMAPYQGEQVLAEKKPTYDLLDHIQWYDLVVSMKQGTMTPEEFDKTTADVVNFLAYAASPFHAEQRKIGFWVLGYLVVLFVFMFLLKKAYWKDVKRRDE